ncbi:MAG: phosphodiesterase [Clostridia bacterium]|nr:phosphodiesterase [Clostridia bacterium]
MKWMFASDLHGDLAAARAVMDVFHKEQADRLILLGDLLYHGPRNNLPAAYDPKGVIALLNEYRHKIMTVRGNCDTEVDQMVLEFPILADYAILPLDGDRLCYLTHGHRFNEQTPPPMGERDILIHGHSHAAGVTACRDGQLCLNPGSVSMPKNDTPPCYMILAEKAFEIRRLQDGTLFAKADI